MKQFFLSFLLLCILLSCQSVKDTTPATATPPPAAPTTTSTPTNNPRVDSLLRLSKQYIEQQKVKEALTALAEALKIDPKNSDVYYEMGLAYAYSKDMPNAIKNFDNAIQFNPSNAKAHGNLGFALYLVEDRENAEIHLRKAIELDPQNGKFYHNLGAFLTDTNDPTACEYLRKARQLGYNDPTHFLEQKCK
ncbi:MAG TPA: tetratricopeptide repeat protein [Chitinophagales bacterium]|nr:tetratricopeptide repeat protein [Chitinophagales bacterium]